MRFIHNINNKKDTFRTELFLNSDSTQKDRTHSFNKSVVARKKAKERPKARPRRLNLPENYIVIFEQNDRDKIDRYSTQTIGHAVNGEDKRF